MPLTLDGYEVLSRIGSNAFAFPDLNDDLAKAAETFVKKQLNARTLTLDGFRALVAALGDETVLLVFEILKARQLTNLARRLDPHHPNVDDGDAAWAKRHLLDLAHGRIAPAVAPEKVSLLARTRSTFSKPPIADPFGTSAMGARRG